jgi:signal recognition particle subunit SRP54
MFETLTQRLSDTVQRLRGKSRLSDANISEAVREVRVALLEADVALPVVQAFIQRVKVRAVGQEVLRSLTPGKTFIGIVNQELVSVMGSTNSELNLAVQPPAVILLAGLQGSGKTTTAGKLAKHLKEKLKKRVMLVSADVYRPAAIEQLRILGETVGVKVHPSNADQQPLAIAEAALDAARKSMIEVLIVDTAGRLAIDQAMMAEVKALHGLLKPVETLFVVDAMTGQDAAATAKAFSETLPLTGVVLTKTDGDARGGAALSVRHVTGRPIKFIGRGEKVDALEPFHPERIASRILGMGDVVTLVEQVASEVDREKAEKLANKVLGGKGFDFNDMRDQMEQLRKMGGLSNLLDKLPVNLGQGKLPMADLKERMNEKLVDRTIAIINSMTPEERRSPELLNASRKQRIARGSGVQMMDVNNLIKQVDEMRRMMKKMSSTGVKGLLKNFQRRIPAGGQGGPAGGGHRPR